MYKNTNCFHLAVPCGDLETANKFFPIFAPGWISIPVKNLENCEIILASKSNFAIAKKFAILWKKIALTPG